MHGKMIRGLITHHGKPTDDAMATQRYYRAFITENWCFSGNCHVFPYFRRPLKGAGADNELRTSRRPFPAKQVWTYHKKVFSYSIIFQFLIKKVTHDPRHMDVFCS